MASVGAHSEFSTIVFPMISPVKQSTWTFRSRRTVVGSLSKHIISVVEDAISAPVAFEFPSCTACTRDVFGRTRLKQAPASCDFIPSVSILTIDRARCCSFSRHTPVQTHRALHQRSPLPSVHQLALPIDLQWRFSADSIRRSSRCS